MDDWNLISIWHRLPFFHTSHFWSTILGEPARIVSLCYHVYLSMQLPKEWLSQISQKIWVWVLFQEHMSFFSFLGKVHSTTQAQVCNHMELHVWNIENIVNAATWYYNIKKMCTALCIHRTKPLVLNLVLNTTYFFFRLYFIVCISCHEIVS